MAYAYQQGAIGATATSPVAATFGSTPTTGHLMLCVVYDQTSSTQPVVSDTNGNWTLLKSETRSATQTIYIFGLIAVASQPKVVTATQSGDTLSTIIYEYSGNASTIGAIIDNLQAAGTTGSAAANSSTTPPSVTNTDSGDLIFSALGVSGTGGTSAPTWSQSMVLRGINPISTSALIWGGELIPAAKSTYNPFSTWATSRAWV